MKYYDRTTGQCLKEEGYAQGSLDFLYQTVPGRALLKWVVKPFFSQLACIYKRSVLSKRSIQPFAERYGVNLSPEELEAFRSFNDFFIRKRDVSFSDLPSELCALADSRVCAYPITSDLCLGVKGSVYSIDELIGDEDLAKRFADGICLVFRLAMNDMHRYYYFDDGKVVSCRALHGELHTVRPISERYRVFVRNKRSVTVMETAHFGCAVQIEIGALLVGKINNHPAEQFCRGEEKGYFELGGSTIVLLLEKNIRLDEDIMTAMRDGLETRVRAGERIGIVC